MMQPLFCTLLLEIDTAITCSRYIVQIGAYSGTSAFASIRSKLYELSVVTCKMEVPY